MAASTSSTDGDNDLVDSVRERAAELSGSDSTGSMETNDLEEDPGYRVSGELGPVVLFAFCFCRFVF